MNRLDAVHNLAKRKVEQYGLVPPVNLYPVFESINVEIVEESNYLGIEAYSKLDNNPKVIINPEITYYEPRKQFTLAHELGHIFIPWHNGDIKCNTDNHYVKIGGRRLLDTQELEANIFASDILMPVEWLKEIIDTNQYQTFDKLVEEISSRANTSIMACFYALEQVLPSGYIYLVKRETSEWWSFFFSKNSYTINWFSYSEDKIDFIEALALTKEVYKIGPYDVILYKMIPCPKKNEICNIYENTGFSLEKLINNVTDGVQIRALPFMDILLSAISQEKYIAFIFQNDEIIKRILPESSPLNRFCSLLNSHELINIACSYGFKFEKLNMGYGICLVYILEKQFKMVQYTFSDPNPLLRRICQHDKSLLQSINGVMASVNNMYGEKSLDELYNWSKYKFISDQRYKEIISHPEFDKYIVNKLISMKIKSKKYDIVPQLTNVTFE